MERNKLTFIENLIEGDIFYKYRDNKQMKLQVHKIDRKKERYICVPPELSENLRDREFLQKVFKFNQQVIFLRRTRLTDIGNPATLLPTEKNVTTCS
jgi:hypothetical protein